MNEKVIPAVLIVLNVAAAVVYGFKGDVRHCIYWLSSAVLLSVVTF